MKTTLRLTGDEVKNLIFKGLDHVEVPDNASIRVVGSGSGLDPIHGADFEDTDFEIEWDEDLA